MELGFQLLLTLAAGGIMGFVIGHQTAKWPNEETMMDRLIVAATERRMLGVTRKKIEVDIEAGVVANLKRP